MRQSCRGRKLSGREIRPKRLADIYNSRAGKKRAKQKRGKRKWEGGRNSGLLRAVLWPITAKISDVKRKKKEKKKREREKREEKKQRRGIA